jgi:hypothetical protein
MRAVGAAGDRDRFARCVEHLPKGEGVALGRAGPPPRPVVAHGVAGRSIALLVVQNLLLGEDAGADPAVQRRALDEIDLASPEQLPQLRLGVQDGADRPVARLEVDQHVDVAPRPKVVAEDRAEQGEPPDAVAPGKLGELVLGNVQIGDGHGHRPFAVGAAEPRGTMVSRARPRSPLARPAATGRAGARRWGIGRL